MSVLPSSVSLVSVACLLLAVGVFWQKPYKSKPTWLKELSHLGRPRKHKFPDTAIICGGRIAGIVTARVCADHFQRVLLNDPEIQDPDKLQYNASQLKYVSSNRYIGHQISIGLPQSTLKYTMLDCEGRQLLGDQTSIESVAVRLSDSKQASLNDVAMVADCTGAAQGG
ncbi:hypothetical protein B0H19DRAFT_1073504 [Mycena capillaripes]|nr:hypothetical protein B0H19DRAFT_1073504 [Mycena capillaripes]